MSCSKCGTTTAGCGCKDTAYTTPVVTTCVPDCPPKCAETISATCVLMHDGIDDIGSMPGDSVESVIQRLTLILTNPLCVNWNPGSGGGGTGGGIIQVGLVTSSNLFDTPIVPVTTPGGDLILNLSNQNANTVFAGPSSGPSDTPAFRSLVKEDLPPLTDGTSILMGDGAGFFANVTVGTGLTFVGGVLSATATPGNTYTVNNGLVENPSNNFQLGGPLVKDTAITGGVNAYNLSLNTLKNFAISSAQSIVMSSNTTIDYTAVDHRFFNSANNRIANISSTLGQFTLDGYYAGTGTLYTATPAYALGVDNVGNVLKVPFNTAATGDITGDNGITNNTTSNVRLGGPLVQDTQIKGGSLLGGPFDLAIGDPGSTDPMATLTLHASTALELNTPNIIANGPSLVNGQVFRLIDKTTGKGDWDNAFTLTTTGTTGAATYDGNTLNIPVYAASYTVENGLSPSTGDPTVFWLGGYLIRNTIIDGTSAFSTTITSAKNAASTLTVSNTDPSSTSAGSGLTVTSTKGDGILVTAEANAITSTAITGYAIAADSAASGAAVAQFTSKVTGSGTVVANTRLVRSTGSGSTTGFGQSIDFLLEESTGGSNPLANRIVSKWTDSTLASLKSQLEFWGVENGTSSKKMHIGPSGQLFLDSYVGGTFDASPTSYLGVDSSGNVVTGPGGSGPIIQNGGTALTQRGTIDITGSLTATDDAVNSRTKIIGPTSSNGIQTLNTDFRLGSPLGSITTQYSGSLGSPRFINTFGNSLTINGDNTVALWTFAATATPSAGQINTITVTNPGVTGSNYFNNTLYTQTSFIITGGGGGSGLQFTGSITFPIADIIITNGGSNYPAGTTVTIAAPGGTGGTQATATPVIKDGVIVGVNMTSNGSGYNAANPTSVTVTFSGSGGAGATGVVVYGKGQLIALTVTNPGSGYTAPVNIAFNPAQDTPSSSNDSLLNINSVAGSGAVTCLNLTQTSSSSSNASALYIGKGGVQGTAIRISNTGTAGALYANGPSTADGTTMAGYSNGYVAANFSNIGFHAYTNQTSAINLSLTKNSTSTNNPFIAASSATLAINTATPLTNGEYIRLMRSNDLRSVSPPTVPNNSTDISGVGSFINWYNPLYQIPLNGQPLVSSTYGSSRESGRMVGLWRNAQYNTAVGGFDFILQRSTNPGGDPNTVTPALNTVLRLSGDGTITFPQGLPTSSAGLTTGDLYTQTAAQLGGSGLQKVICIV